MNRVRFEIIEDQHADITEEERQIVYRAFAILERASDASLMCVLLQAASGEWAVMVPHQDVPDPWVVDGILLDYLEYARGL